MEDKSKLDRMKMEEEERKRRLKQLESGVMSENEKRKGLAAGAGAALIKRKRMMEDL